MDINTDLITIKQTGINRDNNNNDALIQPKPVTYTSIPTLLKSFQNEWDSIMLESYNLKKMVNNLREQLSHQLYQYDAALRVIARLTKERDIAREKLANVKQNINDTIQENDRYKEKMKMDNNMDDDDLTMNDLSNNRDNGVEFKEIMKDKYKDVNGMTDGFVEYITECAGNSATSRKQRSKSIDLDSVIGVMKSYTMKSTWNICSDGDGGINCFDINGKYGYFGLNNAQIIGFNIDNSKIEYVLRKHSDRVNDIKRHGVYDLIGSASDDNSAIVWHRNAGIITDLYFLCLCILAHNLYIFLCIYTGKWKPAMKMDSHNDRVINFEFHGLNDYCITGSKDGLWKVYSMYNEKIITQSKYESKQDISDITKLSLHPDGQIIGTSSKDNLIKIWDIRSSDIKHEFNPSIKSNEYISNFQFNNNGYLFVTSNNYGIINIWDLRKLSKIKDKKFESYKIINEFENNKIDDIKFDYYTNGMIMGISLNKNIYLGTSKKWIKINSFNNIHKKYGIKIKFNINGNGIYSISKDGYLNYYST